MKKSPGPRLIKSAKTLLEALHAAKKQPPPRTVYCVAWWLCDAGVPCVEIFSSLVAAEKYAALRDYAKVIRYTRVPETKRGKR